jgi:nitroreductase
MLENVDGHAGATTMGRRRTGPPVDGTVADELRAVVDYAVLAPSGHNTQPWQFKVVAETLELWADRRRALPIVDPHGRELTISCGAALAFVRIAIGRWGTTLSPRSCRGPMSVTSSRESVLVLRSRRMRPSEPCSMRSRGDGR